MSGAAIADGGMPWLDASGPESAMVLSTRIRLARNLTGQPFRGRNIPEQRDAIVSAVAAAAHSAPSLADAALHRLDTMPAADRCWLNERQLVSRNLAGTDAQGRARSGAALLLGRTASVMVNEEDHLRLQVLQSGLAIAAAYRISEQADRELGVRLSFAFHPEFGYLTACPTNVGTGLRASVLIHLPALVTTREIGKVLEGLMQVGLTSRGLFGEGSEAIGSLFQLSNQTTLGKSEAELLDHLSRMVRQVMDYELRARGQVRRDASTALEDSVWRAWAVLRHARALTFEEVVGLLSSVRLGVTTGILPAIPLQLLNRLLVLTQNAHIARDAGVPLDDDALPVHRASFVRRLFEEGERP